MGEKLGPGAKGAVTPTEQDSTDSTEQTASTQESTDEPSGDQENGDDEKTSLFRRKGGDA